MLGWFTKKKTVNEDTTPVADALSEHEGNAAESEKQVPQRSMPSSWTNLKKFS